MIVPPPHNGANSSKIDRSKQIEVAASTPRSSAGAKTLSAQVRKATALRWVIATPLGVPVELGVGKALRVACCVLRVEASSFVLRPSSFVRSRLRIKNEGNGIGRARGLGREQLVHAGVVRIGKLGRVPLVEHPPPLVP